ncbi:hypothetical protein [Chitinophaga sp.]|uniref:hypothetical protein n=1 Tax=Chitinophaga sp. TaxID=1869181 RepID=UPI002F9526E5
MDKSDLTVRIINKSKSKIYVGALFGCDSCSIMQDVRAYCLRGANESAYPKVIDKNETAKMYAKYLGSIRIYVINLDSLDSYCRLGGPDDISKEKWVKIMGNTNIKESNKYCEFVVK